MTDLKRTPLFDFHVAHGAKMVAFAGYEMPVQYGLGVMKEHIATRESAGLFDVSHMGQVIVRPKDGQYETAALALESLIPVNIAGLAEGRQRYGFFTNDAGGIMDDLMLANRGDHVFVVVNAACKEADLAHMRASIADVCEIEEITDRALIAVQGPRAVDAVEAVAPGLADMKFMDVRILDSQFGELWVSRSGYTGEDGVEVSVPQAQAAAFAEALVAQDSVEAIGLGARDSLRLEAGLCLYGNDLTPETSPVEAALTWGIQKIRRTGGARAGGFPGASRILDELENGAPRTRVGLLPQGRAPMRDGTALFAQAEGGEPIGRVTSGAFGPTIGRPMSMGYVSRDYAASGTTLYGEVRGKRHAATVSDMPFTPANFKR